MSDSRLERPLENTLEPVLDEARKQAIGRRVRAARQERRRRVRPGSLALAGTLAALVLALVWRFTTTRAGPVGLSDGTPLPQQVTATEQPATWNLSDGSVVTLRPHSSAEVITNRADSITMLVRRGEARFEVNPRASRRWFIEAGLLTVEVVGTVLSVERSPAGVAVRVERGVVAVRSELLHDRIQRLEAGQSTFVPAPEQDRGSGKGEGPGVAHVTDGPTIPQPPGGKPSPAAPPQRRPLDSPRPPLAPPSEPSMGATPPGPVREPAPIVAAPPLPEAVPAADVWKQALARGDFAGAWAAMQRSGLDKAMGEATSEELFALADAARGSAHPKEAARVLEFMLARGALSESATASAAFTLGRIELDELGHPWVAAAHFARAAQYAPIAEEALLRRAQALWLANQDDEARAVASLVVKRYPQGVQTARLKGWLEGTTDAPWRR